MFKIRHVEIPLANIRPGATIDQWFQIFDKKRKLAGEVKMKIYLDGANQNNGALGKQILNQNLGVQAQQQNMLLQQQQAAMQQQQQQLAAQKAAMLQQQQQQAQLQAQLQQQQQQMMMQQQANMLRRQYGHGHATYVWWRYATATNAASLNATATNAASLDATARSCDNSVWSGWRSTNCYQCTR